jgi:superfamily II DNA/RNA helicase
VKDVYLHHLLITSIASLQQEQQPSTAAAAAAAAAGGSSGLPAGLSNGARSAIIFVSTCKGCKVLDQVLRELGIPAASLHSGELRGGMGEACGSGLM